MGEQLASGNEILLALTWREVEFRCEFNGKTVVNPWEVGREGGWNGRWDRDGVELPKQKKEWDEGRVRWRVGRTVEGRTLEGRTGGWA